MVLVYKRLGKFICWVFQYNGYWKNLWKFLGVFLMVPYFQNMIEWMPRTRGYTPYFILGKYIFSRCYKSFSYNIFIKVVKSQ